MNEDRREQVAAALRQAGDAGLICRLPHHVLLLTGYLPVLGNSFCVVALAPDGTAEARLAVPASEADLVPPGAAVAVKTYTEENLDFIGTTLQAVRQPLAALLAEAGLAGDSIIGYEGAPAPLPPTYTQMGVPGADTLDLYHALLPAARLRDATNLLEDLAAVKTEREIAGIRRTAAVARAGFDAARAAVRVSATEAEVAAAATAALLRAGLARSAPGRTQPHAHVLAGPRAAAASASFNLTSTAEIQHGDPVLVQIEIGMDGFWAELTRTFFAGEAASPWGEVARACVRAQDAALARIRDEARGADVDAAARDVMRAAGWGDAFRHGLGHGIGFQAINHGAAPILHPRSQAVLRAGMVHNLEPAAYLDGQGGFRLNDDVLVREGGAEVLSAEMPRDLDWLVVPG
ncbi:MAG TPA: M24 family metallopeptidase [Ktedonobacterales bacterium]|jgi:Xaa-Pro aminopeptidase